MKHILAAVFGIDDREMDEVDAETLICRIRSRNKQKISCPSTSGFVTAGINDQDIQVRRFSILSGLRIKSMTSNVRSVIRPHGICPASNRIEDEPILTIMADDCQRVSYRICIREQVRTPQAMRTSWVCCEVTYELLKYLIDRQYPLVLENAGYELKDGVLVGTDGCCVDAEILGNLLSRVNI